MWMNSTGMSPIESFFPHAEDFSSCPIATSIQMNSDCCNGLLSPTHYQEDSGCVPPLLCTNELEDDQSNELPVELGTTSVTVSNV